MKTVLRLVSGSRGRGNSCGFCQRIELKEVRYYGDERDYYGVRTQRNGSDITSIWTVPTLVDKALRFQYEALEILFCHPSNLTIFHAGLFPLYAERESLVCQQMCDKLSNRGMTYLKKGLTSKKTPYDSDMLCDGLDLLKMAQHITCSGRIYPQSVRDDSSMRHHIQSKAVNIGKIKSYFQSVISEIRRGQLEWTRAKTAREMWRGEGPQPKVASLLSPANRNQYRDLIPLVLENLRTMENRELVGSELKILYGNQDHNQLSYYIPDEDCRVRASNE